MRTGAAVFIALFCICFGLKPQGEHKPVTGKLVRQIAIGGESSGWAIELESELTVDGQQVHSIEIEFHDVNTLDKLANQRVEAAGTLSHRRGVETGQRPVLEVS